MTAPSEPLEGPAPGANRRRLVDGSEDLLIGEEPLLLVLGEARLLTMRTPGNDADLALGFLLSEGVLAAAGDLEQARFAPGDAAARRPDTLHLQVRGALLPAAQGRLTRTHEVRPSCGVCGLTDADAILEDLPPLLPGVPRVPRGRIDTLRQAFATLQRTFAATGACHGAALFAADGAVLGHGEDVGRHNALDKAIGMAARAGHDLTRAIALLSGRAGFDLVVKCLRLRVPVILSVSAPSALAFDLCQAAGATLVGFVRAGRAKVYWDGGRLVP